MEANERERILQKVKKLMTLALDGRGNETEAETALRQAQSLMAKFNIDESEVIRADLLHRRAEVIIERWKKAGMNTKEGGTKSRDLPTWAGVLGLGVAIFCDCRGIVKEVREHGNNYGKCVVFAGYNADVEVACWTFDYLLDCIRRRSRAFNSALELFAAGKDVKAILEFGLTEEDARILLVTTTSKGRGDTFRFHMAGRLQKRMKEMKEQWKQQQATSSTALVVLNDKAVALREVYGEERSRPAVNRIKGHGAAAAGINEGNKTRLQPNPIGNNPSPPPRLLLKG